MITIDKSVNAIIQFGPATAASGMRPGEYLQVVIDPNMASPQGEFLRFDQRFQKNSELNGWQRIECITICEILGAAEAYDEVPEGYIDGGKPINMNEAEHGE